MSTNWTITGTREDSFFGGTVTYHEADYTYQGIEFFVQITEYQGGTGGDHYFPMVFYGPTGEQSLTSDTRFTTMAAAKKWARQTMRTFAAKYQED